MDYYKILGVEKTATTDEIKTAFRKLSFKYHPDVSKAKNAAEKFAEIREAYEILSDPEARRKYDSPAEFPESKTTPYSYPTSNYPERKPSGWGFLYWMIAVLVIGFNLITFMVDASDNNENSKRAEIHNERLEKVKDTLKTFGPVFLYTNDEFAELLLMPVMREKQSEQTELERLSSESSIKIDRMLNSERYINDFLAKPDSIGVEMYLKCGNGNTYSVEEGYLSQILHKNAPLTKTFCIMNLDERIREPFLRSDQGTLLMRGLSYNSEEIAKASNGMEFMNLYISPVGKVYITALPSRNMIAKVDLEGFKSIINLIHKKMKPLYPKKTSKKNNDDFDDKYNLIDTTALKLKVFTGAESLE